MKAAGIKTADSHARLTSRSRTVSKINRGRPKTNQYPEATQRSIFPHCTSGAQTHLTTQVLEMGFERLPLNRTSVTHSPKTIINSSDDYSFNKHQSL
jgi:hypothetical protein